MLITQSYFEEQYFPLVSIKEKSNPESDLYISKKGNIVKQLQFSVEYWQVWETYFIQEVQIQQQLHESDSQLFLGIKHWVVHEKFHIVSISIVYENILVCQNLIDFVQSSQFLEETIPKFIENLLRIGLQLQKFGIFHFNITPNNLIYMNGMIKLTDFSSSRVIHDHYFAKQQNQNKILDYHFYQNKQILKLLQLSDNEIDEQFVEIINNQTLFNSIFQSNDQWALSIIIAQLITKNIFHRITKYEEFYSINENNLKNLLKQVRSCNSIYYPICSKLLEQQLDFKSTFEYFIEQQQYTTKKKKNQVKPIITRLEPIVESNSQQEKLSIKQKDYFYVTLKQIQKLESQRVSIPSEEEIQKRLFERQQSDERSFHIMNSENTTKESLFFQNTQQNRKDHTFSFDQEEVLAKYIGKLLDFKNIDLYASSTSLMEKQIKFLQLQLTQNDQMNLKRNYSKQITLCDIDKACYKDNLFDNSLEVQFYKDFVLKNDKFSNLYFSFAQSFDKNQVFSYQNEVCSYIGQQLNQKPNGIGIQQRKKDKNQFIIGEFLNGFMKNCLIIELLNEQLIQIYQGKFNQQEQKQGNCLIEWYEIQKPQSFELIQQHKGIIDQNLVSGVGMRKYYKNDDQKQYLYIGEFKNSKKDGQGQLFEMGKQELQLIYSGKFQEDKYHGVGEGFYNQKVKINAEFKKGKISCVTKTEYRSKHIGK